MVIFNKIIILLILIFGLALRIYGQNWDQNFHLHPDERFLTMVTTDLAWPDSLSEYLDAETSRLNPHNRGYGFFVYGTFPIFLTKLVGESLSRNGYGNITLVGRTLSAFFDLGTLLFIFLIAQETELKVRNHAFRVLFPLLAMLFYSVSVLPIQLSHFYSVETFLTFFISSSFYFLIKLTKLTKEGITITAKLILFSLSLGASFGLSLASKISAALFIPIVGLGLLIWFYRIRNIRRFLTASLLIVAAMYLTLRLFQPYLFASSALISFDLNQKVLDNWKELQSFAQPDMGFPPGIQWINAKPLIFPLKNLIVWGLGLPLGIIALSAVWYTIYWLVGYFRSVRKDITKFTLNNNLIVITLICFWILFLFIFQGLQFSKNMRYFHPIYPYLAIISAFFLVTALEKSRARFSYIITLIVASTLSILIYPASYLAIYYRPHTRIYASEWIYANIPTGSELGVEHWDDGLPLPLPGFAQNIYSWTEFPLYGQDNAEKWKDMDSRLRNVDYIILTSNRLYGSITTVPEKFPITNIYYQKLFENKLGFRKVAEFTSRPTIPIPFIKVCLTPPWDQYGKIAYPTQECLINGISFVDDYADESFTVYDHPKVTIFKKVQHVDYFNSIFSKKL
ncbi:hypothetical protein A2774_01465 [Candidatus Roizmanbacteria bacterium RIFCSPHIGHO2_01_FULL_39_12c]|uniref:Glycosyltransferase RgtA/B/C/D-like domain-containing protein n=1 Tax=Candidatus Roizmanbacteria bacterium RIFCSPHIGHO2_01_FULL_39_12c TaxID=1802031 RepID=A0A1F7G879_9BACT|nr:MAG: hypothetical protein A2774_01465 [Candidatus Roizmanbacteria bacterium RIFCSPHIGHO2_01_FULL_39_12c]OGK46574.1 MAG: hypothetical protein A2963_02470 [Candidatus Roizmanbacteria bacterium RIFCSPLOWO2_01_FULL_40_13]